jgi:glycosyltransferase involved in cell wall biosynthesis
VDSSAVTVVIPTIPTRQRMFERALRSVARQTHGPAMTVVEIDLEKSGAAATRQRGLDRVETEFVAFLDDDDELFPRHLELLAAEQARTGADVVYPWFEVVGGTDPFPEMYGKPFDLDRLRTGQYIPITVLARTEAVRAAGGFREQMNELGWTQEDWVLWLTMADQGRSFVHLPRRTWSWHHHGGNTSGNAKNW